jgi:hypothetical protein
VYSAPMAASKTVIEPAVPDFLLSLLINSTATQPEDYEDAAQVRYST